MSEPVRGLRITVDVNGERHERDVEARRLLVHFLRDDLDLTGTHVGCDTGNCGACTVIVDGLPVKSCMILAVQPDGRASRPWRVSLRTASCTRSSKRSAPSTRSSAVTARPAC